MKRCKYNKRNVFKTVIEDYAHYIKVILKTDAQMTVREVREGEELSAVDQGRPRSTLQWK